jgi:error-prone DNA polymerase
LRSSLPDIDIDVESHRRLEVYDAILERFGGTRVACVSMMETYRVRHAIRDVGAAVGLPPADVNAFAKAFPHIRARDARNALSELPELRRSSFGAMARSGQLDEILDLVHGLDGLPRHIALHPCGVLLSDSALLDRTPVQASNAGFPMSHYDKDDVETLGFLKLDVLGIRMQSAMSHALSEISRTEDVDVDIDAISFDDPPTFDLIASTRTLGCFQIESPGQRELIGKLAPETFNDIIVDISLFRPGPVKSDMITPFLNARHGWKSAQYLHPDLIPVLKETSGVVVFHEQVIKVVSIMTGCTFAEADEIRRGLGDWDRMQDIRAWFYPEALKRGYDLDVVDQVWEVLRAFASFGFCKAHAGAFAVPTYQSAWLKTHHPAAFYAGVLTHDPGMYPKRLILEDARQTGVAILGVDVNASRAEYVVEPTPSGLGVRIALSQIKGISEEEVESLINAQPFTDINDVWNRAEISRPTLEKLVLAGAFDGLYGILSKTRRGSTTRRDLYVHAAELDRWRSRRADRGEFLFDAGINPVPLVTGLPEMDDTERMHAELDILGMDVSHHVLSPYEGLIKHLGIVRSKDLLNCRSRQEVFVVGVKVATQTPPVRSGKRVIFLTLDDAPGPVDAAFFEDAQGEYSQTVFHSWLMVVRGVVRRTGPRGISINATGAWDLTRINTIFDEASHTPHGFNPQRGVRAVHDFFDDVSVEDEEDVELSQSSHSSRSAGGMKRGRRVLVHPSGFRLSPWADVIPAGGLNPPAKLWHTSPGSPG